MDSSRRAVEAYWRSRMIDAVTSDEDKVAPVYKLEEICDLLRTSHVSIVKEVSEYILKRLDHKSPVVKQKALRVIKYSVGKSGIEFRREMQRNSVAMRQLFHYKGYPDPLKGDALNKAVRDTAHEAITAIFAAEDNKAVATEGVGKRMEGFGNTNFDTHTEDKRSFLSEVVGLGSASIKQGLSNIAAAHSARKSDTGSYRSPNLRKSLTNETDGHERYKGDDNRESWTSSGVSNTASRKWNPAETQTMTVAPSNGDAGPSQRVVKTHEEKLLETIVTSGGVRLQPTRDAIQLFLLEASKLNPVEMCIAIESKLQSNLWQVRMKALCVLESVIRKREDEQFSNITSYFTENRDCIVKCSESPQVSLREKASKVLNLLGDESTSGTKGQHGDRESSTRSFSAPNVSLPDLIDTYDPNENGIQGSSSVQIHQSNVNFSSANSLVDDLFANETSDAGKNEDDPFSDVSFHVGEERKQVDDLFSGLTIDETGRNDEATNHINNPTSELLDIFGSNTIQALPQSTPKNVDVHDIMSGFSATDAAPLESKNTGFSSLGNLSGTTDTLFNLNNHVSSSAPNSQNDILNPQLVGMGQNGMLPTGSVQFNIPPNVMLNQALASQPISYGAMGNFITQQQFLYQNHGAFNVGNLQSSSASIPDIFQISNNPVLSHNTVTNSSRKDDTKAFDFISEHLSAARDPKRVI